MFDVYLYLYYKIKHYLLIENSNSWLMGFIVCDGDTHSGRQQTQEKFYSITQLGQSLIKEPH